MAIALRTYRPEWLPADALAALLLAAIAIPEQMATARLLGVAPMAGLVAFAAGTLCFAIFGRNALLSVGADSTIAPIMAAALAGVATVGSVTYTDALVALSLMIGAVLLLAAPLRLGWLAVLLSIPVTTGFLAGIAVHIVISQLPAMTGMSAPALHALLHAGDPAALLAHVNALAVTIALAVFGLSIAAERISRMIPGALIAVGLSTLAAWWFDLPAHAVAVLGAVPSPVTALHVPSPAWSLTPQLAPYALIVALVCMIQTAAVLQSYASPTAGQSGVARDFAAIGGGSLLAALLGGFAVNSSPPRTAVVAESGGRTQLAGLIALALVIALVLFGRGMLSWVPEAALAGVLIYIAMRILRIGQMRAILRQSPWEFTLVLAAAACVVLLPIHIGVTLSILLSFLHGIYVFARPNCGELSRVPGTTIWWSMDGSDEEGEREPGVLVFAFGSPLSFVNADYLVSHMCAAIDAMKGACRLVVIEATGVIDVDYTGAQRLIGAIGDLHEKGIAVALARMESPQATKQARSTGLIAAIGEDHVFMSVEEAIAAMKPARADAAG